MRKILSVALLFATYTVYSQGQTLAEVSLLKPKIGQSTAFEAAWKTHVAKFHSKDDKLTVYQILSGEYAGAYQVVRAPIAFADLDKDNPNMLAHDRDYDLTIAPKLEIDRGPNIYGYRDSLSFNPDVQSDKAVVTVTRVKVGKMQDYLQEVKRSAAVSNGKAPYGINTYVQMFAGSEPTVVTIRSLKDGFKELEANYFKRPPNEFQTEYVKAYSKDQYDQRQAILQDNMSSREVYLMKIRRDLSSPRGSVK